MAIKLTQRFFLNFVLIFILSINGALASSAFAESSVVNENGCKNGPAVEKSELGSSWLVFRSAVLSGNMDAVIKLAHFPVVSAGMLDSDPIMRVSARNFPNFFIQYLKLDSGQSAQIVTNEQYIIDNPCLSDIVLNEQNDSAQVAGLVFSLIDHRWQLTRVYSNKEE